MTCQTDPSRCEAAERSRAKREGDFQLDPPAEMPALFSCLYRKAPAVGAVYRNGLVCVVPDRCDYGAIPCMFYSLRSAESSKDVSEIVWEWGVVRLLDTQTREGEPC